MHFVIEILLLSIPWEISARIFRNREYARLSLAEPNPNFYYNRIDSQAGTYGFGYDVADPTSGNTQYRNEERYPNGTVVGSFGYLDPSGKPHRYRYTADHKGYRIMRERPFTLSAPAIINISGSPSEQMNEITWTRKKTNGANTNPFNTKKLEDRKFMQYPFRYFYQ